MRLTIRGYFAGSVPGLLAGALLVAACASGPQDEPLAKRARTTYEKYLPAAENGDFKAQNLIGFMHFFGEGAPVDREYAHFWFHLAAESGFPPALRNLAVMHWRGLGTTRDLDEARRYALAGGFADLDQLATALPPTRRSEDRGEEPDWSAVGRPIRSAEATYATYCAGCHGLNGISAYVASPSFALGERMDKPDDELFHSLHNGKGVMPAWGEIFSEARLREVLAFVRGLQADYDLGIARGIRRAPEFYYLFGPMRNDHRAYRGATGN